MRRMPCLNMLGLVPGASALSIATSLLLLCALAMVGLPATAQTRLASVPAASAESPAHEAAGMSDSDKANAESGRLPASIPLRREAEADGSAMFGTTQLLMVVAVLAVSTWGLSRWLRSRASSAESRPTGWLGRFAGRSGIDAAQVVSSSRLTGKASLHVVEWDRQQWLIGCTEHSVSVLAKRPVGKDGTSSTLRAQQEGARHE